MSLDEIQARVDAATPGPWEDSDDFYQTVDSPGVDGAIAYDVMRDGDRAFIAAAREDVPYLLARVRALEGALKEYADPDNWEWVDQSNVAGWMCHVADDDTHPWIPASAAMAGGGDNQDV